MRAFMRLALVSLCLMTGMSQAKDEDKLNQLVEEIWQYELKSFPLMASSEGVRDYDAQLMDISAGALEQRHQQFTQYLNKLDEINQKALSRDGLITLLMQRYRLQNYVDLYRFNEHYVPITSEYGFHSSLAQLPNNVRLKNTQDVENYLSRLTLVAQRMQDNMAWMRQGMQVGMTQPKAVLVGFEESVTPLIVDSPEQSPFYAPLEALGEEFTAQQVEKWRTDAKAIIAKQIVPAYQAFHDFLVDEYIPAAREDIAATSWPNGEAFYQNRIRYYTTTDMTAAEIHQLGLDEVARIRAAMQGIIDKLEFEGDINAFIQFLRTDPQFYAKTAQELLVHASYIAKQMDAKLPQLFGLLPRTPYGVAPVPDSIAPKYTTGRYVSPRRDDQPGYYWVNTYALDKRPLYAIPALTSHEAVPGHHLQISLANEMQGLPPVRRKTYISAFGEGWGLYSEFLGKEVGMYEDPYDDFGRLSYEMWRACRLVVDTGMHTMGWSRDKALEYMLENTALSEHNVKTEIDRYISWPAQALSYKIGEIKIKALRKNAEAALGEHFDIRQFHDAVLAEGSVPLFILEQNIEQFIQTQLERTKE
ncbi:DUF885 domain-containing protein [Alteromonas oceanisediminis]|uniref:DUF885 domain-containing protein n=1 Tax=Alteromonas oceanisediminis TaxID=2836180 RepID=UPI001BDB6355|nr:DUF885 domain-containing protein [Alteromonas oceanisediminis]MBT0586736.1 DUF885 family protein [Alteromonas oceanisediminis]